MRSRMGGRPRLIVSMISLGMGSVRKVFLRGWKRFFAMKDV